MIFVDDRLATVLRQKVSGKRAARTQYRQLLDLIGARHGFAEIGQYEEAWQRLNELALEVPPAERAAIVSERGWRLRNPELAANLANDDAAVAAAALARAELSDDDWSALIPRLPVRARGFLRFRGDLPPRATNLLEKLGVHDRGLPGPQSRNSTTTASSDGAPGDGEEPLVLERELNKEIELNEPVREQGTEETAISALVERIEAFRAARGMRATDEPQLPLGRDPDTDSRIVSAFSFTSDATGRIDWADDDVASMVCGLQLTDALPPLVGKASQMAGRQWIRGRSSQIAGAVPITGEWRIDAAPQFDPATGGFAGYAGMFRRPATEAATAEEDADAERIRQILHELRTPVNAIQGFSEVIQQQLNGPVPHEYRAHAATIASDAARILASFDEIDRLVKLESNALELESGNGDCATIVAQTIDKIEPILSPRMAALQADLPDEGFIVDLEQGELRMLVWRMLATLAGGLAAGEQIALQLSQGPRVIRLECELPAQLASQKDLFDTALKPTASVLSVGSFGPGFAMRLCKAEARAAGGSLARVDDSVILTLPSLTARQAVRSRVN